MIQPSILWVLRVKSLQRTVANFNPALRISIFYSVATLLVGLPQLAFALLGGLAFP